MMDALRRLIEAESRLFADCNWHASLPADRAAKYLADEVEELRSALRVGAPWRIREEFGDVLWSAILIATRIATEIGVTCTECVDDVLKKVYRRNDHVFGHELPNPARWSEVKKDERVREAAARRYLIATVSGLTASADTTTNLQALARRLGWRVLHLEDDQDQLWAVLRIPGDIEPEAGSYLVRSQFPCQTPLHIEWARVHNYTEK